MPIVMVYMWKGLSEDRAKTIIENITQVFVDLGIPQTAVEVVINEISKSDWGIGGVPASEKFEEKAPGEE